MLVSSIVVFFKCSICLLVCECFLGVGDMPVPLFIYSGRCQITMIYCILTDTNRLRNCIDRCLLLEPQSNPLYYKKNRISQQIYIISEEFKSIIDPLSVDSYIIQSIWIINYIEPVSVCAPFLNYVATTAVPLHVSVWVCVFVPVYLKTIF